MDSFQQNTLEGFCFSTPTKLYYGRHAASQVGPVLREAGIKHVFIIYGMGSVKRVGAYDDTVASLRSAGVTFIEKGGVRPNPELDTTYELLQMLRASPTKIEAIVPIGGGSTIDTAKAVAAAAELGPGATKSEIWEMYEEFRAVQSALPIYSVLTISATGSEANGGSVIQNDAEQKKFFIRGPGLYPKASFIDPEYQKHLPWFQTANGLVDAMMHMLEYMLFTEDPESVETVFSYDCAMIRSIIRCGDRLQQDAADYYARVNFAWASTCALNGFGAAGMSFGSLVTHMLEHAMGAVDPTVSHGAGLGVAFLAFVRFHGERGQFRKTFNRIAREVFEADVELSDKTDKGWLELVKAFRAMLVRWKHPTNLRELFGKSYSDDIVDVLTSAFAKRPKVGLPLKCSPDDARSIYSLMQ